MISIRFTKKVPKIYELEDKYLDTVSNSKMPFFCSQEGDKSTTEILSLAPNAWESGEGLLVLRKKSPSVAPAQHDFPRFRLIMLPLV